VLLTDLNGEGALVAARVIDAELGVGTAFAIRHDVTSEADWKAAIACAGEALRGLSVLVNDAGIAQLGQNAWQSCLRPRFESRTRSRRPRS
jgi:NAD(P)-dependent dehydrogenase (short-subunit alcohol dehydrogenase family)